MPTGRCAGCGHRKKLYGDRCAGCLSGPGRRHGDSAKLSVADAHQLRILKDTVRNPLKGRFLGGPSAEEAEDVLRSKFKFTSEQIRSLKGGHGNAMPRRGGGTEEYTYTDPRGHGEVMVVRDGDLIVDMYTYKDAHFLTPIGRKGVYGIDEDFDDGRVARFLRWKATANSLFLHVNHRGAAYDLLVRDHGFTSGSREPNRDPSEPSHSEGRGNLSTA